MVMKGGYKWNSARGLDSQVLINSYSLAWVAGHFTQGWTEANEG